MAAAAHGADQGQAAGLHLLDRFLQGLAEVPRIHVKLPGCLLLRPGHRVLDRVVDPWAWLLLLPGIAVGGHLGVGHSDGQA